MGTSTKVPKKRAVNSTPRQTFLLLYPRIKSTVFFSPLYFRWVIVIHRTHRDMREEKSFDKRANWMEKSVPKKKAFLFYLAQIKKCTEHFSARRRWTSSHTHSRWWKFSLWLVSCFNWACALILFSLVWRVNGAVMTFSADDARKCSFAGEKSNQIVFTSSELNGFFRLLSRCLRVCRAKTCVWQCSGERWAEISSPSFFQLLIRRSDFPSRKAERR